ncbi:RHS repeat-associated core domain-containing protein [Tenacibaculum ovolyticum]|uniref:RHS repeat-associated core domain-containing protein n=1 Tax=Tenacibaculum ovolyticum TaxID=104270 RepID=UPI001F2C60F0|nr:RHS repeat-associated core domain-containing protein [Tenacibaculum ovolyticum]
MPISIGQYKDHLGNARLSYVDNNKDGIIQTDGTNSEIIEESNYYPFGLKHKGHNSIKNIGIGNSIAQKFGYNGAELEESLGLDLYEMDVRSYDPTIGRLNGIDSVTHGTSVTFDNNPVYWAYPSGADSTADWMKKNKLTDKDLDNVYDSDDGSTDELVKDIRLIHMD